MNSLSNLPSLRFSCPSALVDHEIFLLVSPLPCLALLCSHVLSPQVQIEALCPLSQPCRPQDDKSVSPTLLPLPGNSPLAGQQVPLQGTRPLGAGFEGAPRVCVCFICERSVGFRDTQAQLSQFSGQAVLLPGTLTLPAERALPRSWESRGEVSAQDPLSPPRLCSVYISVM